MLFLKQPLVSFFLYHKSATTCQIDSYKVSNSKLKSDLCNYVEIEVIDFIAPPQQPHKLAHFFWMPCTSKVICVVLSKFVFVILLILQKIDIDIEYKKD